MNTWNGKGLPPVGVTCERRFEDLEGSTWAQITVIAYGKRKVFYSDKNGDEWGHFTSELEFRPVETKKQKADFQREKTIRQMCLIVLSEEKFSTMDGVAALYDAGYRKFEIVEDDV